MNELEFALDGLDSFQAIQSVLYGVVLKDIQCVDVLKMIAAKHCLVMNDTGTGKTFLISAMMQLLWREDPSRRFLIFIKKDQLIQTPADIEKLTGRRCVATASVQNDIKKFVRLNPSQCSVLMMTHECLNNSVMLEAIYAAKDTFTGVFVDEAHQLNNTRAAKAAGVLQGMAPHFEYFVALTATPMTTSVVQLARLANLVAKDRYPNVQKLKNDLQSGRLRVEDDPCFFITHNHEDYGCKCNYKGVKVWIPAMDWQKDRSSQFCKGVGATRQAEALCMELDKRKGQRGLVYVRRHEVREWLLTYLDNLGMKYECVHGFTPQIERARVMKEFNQEKSLDFVVTSVTTSLNLDCDYVMFYEYPADYKQMIGRAHRGFADKELEVVFLITEGSQEEDYFYDKLVTRARSSQMILHKTCDELDD